MASSGVNEGPPTEGILKFVKPVHEQDLIGCFSQSHKFRKIRITLLVSQTGISRLQKDVAPY